MFGRPYTYFWPELEITEREDRCFGKGESLVTIVTLVFETTQMIKQDQRLVKWAWANRIGKQQSFLLGGKLPKGYRIARRNLLEEWIIRDLLIGQLRPRCLGNGPCMSN